MGHAIGTIYNGITYDYKDGTTPKTAFGRTVLNEARDLTDTVNQNVVWMGDNEMTSGRTTSFSYDTYDESGETYSRFEGVESSLLITEGSPDIIESTYVPVEYSISTPGIGGPSSWDVYLEIVDDDSPGQPSKTMRVVTYNEYDTLNGYVFAGFSDDMYTNVEATGWTAIPASASTDEYGDPTMEFSFPYSGSANVLMCESMKLDDLIYDSRDAQKSQLGYLKSRNIIRHGFNQDYMKRNDMGIIIQRTTLQIPSVRDVIEKMRINVGLDSNLQANKFWQNIEDIIVTWRNGSDYVTVKLLSELGYSIEYEDEDGNEKIVVDVTDVYVDEQDRKTASFIPEDAFTEKALQVRTSWYADVTLVCGGIGSVIPPSGGRASVPNPGCNNIINRVTYENTRCQFRYDSVD